MTTLFISDLHLDAERPDGIDRFLRFIETEAREASALYILGDLFEVWIGDDDTNPSNAPIIKALAALRLHNIPCYFMHGNRDFLIGHRFAAATGCELLSETEILELEGNRVLLMHGDLLCTDDKPYMQFRRVVRDPTWQSEFLAKSSAERQRIADDLRAQSQTAISEKAEEIMDVNQRAVETAMRKHSVTTLLHGHTHQPAIHHFELDGNDATRIVLGSWYDQASVVRWNESGFELTELDL
ncbi:MAG: UDP-2,3-diacylglucosamine diphosphatase [Candidatus Rariloculaceae bacterium]